MSASSRPCPPPLHWSRLTLLLLLAAPWLLACSRTTAPRPPVAIQVINATCDSGPCAPLHVVGFPADQPRTPNGYWQLNLGTDSASTFCLTLPSSGTFRVIAGGVGTSPDTTTFGWSVEDSLWLGTVASGTSSFQATPTTGGFVPATSPGWSVTLPGGTAVTSAPPCTQS